MKLKTLLALAITAILCSCHYRKPLVTGLEGKPLPAFTLMRPDDGSFINTSELTGGKPIVLFYFSIRCPYCRAQLQSIHEKIDDLKDIDFVVATDEPLQAVRQFCKANDLTQLRNFRIAIDTGQFISSYFKTRAVPYTAIYGKNKKLKHAFLGNIYANQIEAVAQD